MSANGTCPVCAAVQVENLACHSCCQKIERALGDVPGLVTELDVTLSKMARIGTPAKGGLAREKNPIHLGAMEASSVLTNVLASWVIDVCGENYPFGPRPSAVTFARDLLNHIPDIRKHPAVDELLDQVTDAVEQARRVVDRPADRMYLGTCLVPYETEADDHMCMAELWARVDAAEVTCRTCGVTHAVADRRTWLLLRAADMLTTVKEASRYIGDIGGITVTEASIRGLIHRKRLAYRPDTTTFRLGDLLDVLTEMRAAA